MTPKTPFTASAGWMPSNANPQPLSREAIAKHATPDQRKKAKAIVDRFNEQTALYHENNTYELNRAATNLAPHAATVAQLAELAELKNQIAQRDPLVSAHAHAAAEIARHEGAALAAEVLEAAAIADKADFDALVVSREAELEGFGIALDISDPTHPGDPRHAKWELWADPSCRRHAERVFGNQTLLDSLRNRDAVATGNVPAIEICQAIAA